MKNKVSIIIPVYNVENYIEKCVQSVINQTYNNIEIILIDDGSTDRSYEIIKKLQKQDKRIKISTRENKGTLYTRLEGVKISTGEYIMYVDSDDYIDSNMVEKMIENSNDADVVRCDYIVENTKLKKKYIPENFYKKPTILEEKNFDDLYELYLMTYQYSGICAQLIKRNFFEYIKFEKSINMCEDLYLNLEILSQVKKIVFIPEAYYHYMIRSNSTCTNLDKLKMKKRIRDCIYIYNKFFEYIKIWNKDDKDTRQKVANRIIKEAFFQIRNLFFVRYSKKEFIDTLNNTLNTDEFNNAITLANKDQMSIYERLLCEKKYDKLYYIASITIKPQFHIKQIIKKILYR